MRKIVSTIMMLMLTMGIAAQTYYTRPCFDKKLQKQASRWMKSGQWRNGFTAAKPHKSVNAVDFYEQYQKNPEQWKALFHWLSVTDLLAIPKGKHPIEGTTLVASVEDSENGPLEKRNSESHYHHIDFQFVSVPAIRQIYQVQCINCVDLRMVLLCLLIIRFRTVRHDRSQQRNNHGAQR